MQLKATCDYKSILKFQSELSELRASKVKPFMKSCIKELAVSLTKAAIESTKDTELETAKTRGTLRRGWVSNTETQAQKGGYFIGTGKVKQFIEKKGVMDAGTFYAIEVSNPVSYARMVERGYRRSDGVYQPPRQMLSNNLKNLEATAPESAPFNLCSEKRGHALWYS